MNRRRFLVTVLVLSLFLPSTAYADIWGRGTCIASIEDLDGDGLRDMLVANRNLDTRECVWAVSSKSGAILLRVEGAQAGDGFGGSIAEIGDVNGDRVSDFAVGAVGTRDLEWQSAADGQPLPMKRVSSGYARIVSGKSGSTLLEFRSGWRGEMDAFTVACGGDVNADGVPDLLVSDMHSLTHAEMIRAGSLNLGRVRVFSGADGAVLHVLVPQSIRSGGSYFGESMAALGDIDRDGYGDFAISAPWARLATPDDDKPRPLGDNGGDGKGAVFVYSGRTGVCVRTLSGSTFGEFGRTIAAAKDGAHANARLLAVACSSRTVTVFSSVDWGSRVLATSHCGVGYLDDFGSSLEFALDKKTGFAVALAIGANESFEPTFDEGYAEVYSLGKGEPLVLARNEKEGIDVCALDDIDGDGRYEYAFIGVKSMRLRVASGKSGEVLREIALAPAREKSK